MFWVVPLARATKQSSERLLVAIGSHVNVYRSTFVFYNFFHPTFVFLLFFNTLFTRTEQ